ncbi:alpha-E domain-containing protein [Pedobacter metabolipauper]|uniref:Putative alpha-E superfamily protein n=1 Tax=Pedobacter metabolipauper TaxID=425513 RepID=A0A4R6SP64_9SPHI|nr:alpha-E domain-containing protein [Pedobacter metabolipauper]TDQ06333.1 putative alpha-E superfamily protein [Pedobacter metabolipauper]
MLSRVASSLYWLSRYVERSDGILRMLKINYASSQDTIQEFTWDPVIRISSGGNEEEMAAIKNDSRSVVEYLLFNRDNPNSIINIITLARENARSVQEHIATDLWQCLNEYYHTVKDPKLLWYVQKDDPITALDILIKQVMLYYGTADSTMERGEIRSFMSIGKYLERSIQSIDILDIKFISISSNPDLLTDTSYWKHLLLSLGGYELYLKTYRGGFEADNIMELVILNKDFPRSAIYSVNNILRYFERLKSDKNLDHYNSLSFNIGRLNSSITYTTVYSMEAEGLHNYLIKLKNELYGIGNLLDKYYFANY